jgi:hypothetical protein
MRDEMRGFLRIGLTIILSRLGSLRLILHVIYGPSTATLIFSKYYSIFPVHFTVFPTMVPAGDSFVHLRRDQLANLVGDGARFLHFELFVSLLDLYVRRFRGVRLLAPTRTSERAVLIGIVSSAHDTAGQPSVDRI